MTSYKSGDLEVDDKSLWKEVDLMPESTLKLKSGVLGSKFVINDQRVLFFLNKEGYYL